MRILIIFGNILFIVISVISYSLLSNENYVLTPIRFFIGMGLGITYCRAIWSWLREIKELKYSK